MIKENYHTHTYRCHHAGGEDRDYVEAALKAGMTTLGFSDHCPFHYPNGYVSRAKMTPEDFEGYRESILSLKDEYKGRIDIKLGFESEYHPERSKYHFKLIEEGKLEYMLLASHWVGDELNGGHLFINPTDDEEILKRYVDSSIEALRTGYYKYMAHPDCLNFTGSDDAFRRHMTRLLEYFKENNLPIELNWLGISTNRHYTSMRFLNLAKEIGITDTIHGVDAHNPEHLLNYAAFEKAEEMRLNMLK